MSLFDPFIVWAMRRTPRAGRRIPVVRFTGEFICYRYHFLWPDEFVDGDQKHWNRPPSWRPFNAFLHQWDPAINREGMHDHPRWTVTVCLRGRIIEHTPWASRELRPGSVVIRSRKAIHAFEVPDEWKGRTWTLFIVGRRNHPQNTYVVERRTSRGQVIEPAPVAPLTSETT